MASASHHPVCEDKAVTPFELSNLVIMPFWLLMVFAPWWSITWRVLTSPWVVAPPALIYLVTLVPVARFVLPEVMQPVQARIADLLGTPTGVTLAWAHFVAFDLFVGRWVYLDSRQRGYSAWWVSPVLIVCLLVGPVGLLLYLTVRTMLGGRDGEATVA